MVAPLTMSSAARKQTNAQLLQLQSEKENWMEEKCTETEAKQEQRYIFRQPDRQSVRQKDNDRQIQTHRQTFLN